MNKNKLAARNITEAIELIADNCSIIFADEL